MKKTNLPSVESQRLTVNLRSMDNKTVNKINMKPDVKKVRLLKDKNIYA